MYITIGKTELRTRPQRSVKRNAYRTHQERYLELSTDNLRKIHIRRGPLPAGPRRTFSGLSVTGVVSTGVQRVLHNPPTCGHESRYQHGILFLCTCYRTHADSFSHRVTRSADLCHTSFHSSRLPPRISRSDYSLYLLSTRDNVLLTGHHLQRTNQDVCHTDAHSLCSRTSGKG